MTSHGLSLVESRVDELSHYNIYRHTYVGGYARVHQGNIYIYHLSTTRAPVGLRSGNTTLALGEYRIMPRILTLSWQTVTRESSHGSQRSRAFRLTILKRYRLYFGFGIEACGDLRVYVPRLRYVIPDESRFIDACKKGDVHSIRRLLFDRMAAVHDVDQMDRSPLFYAIDGGHESAVKELLTNGADANQPFGLFRHSPLSWALYKRQEQIARLLIRNGATLDYLSSTGWSILFYLWRGEMDLQPSCVNFLQILQVADPDVLRLSYNHLVDTYGWSLLSRASCSGTADEIEFLIKSGADIHWKNDYDWSALFEAVFGNKLEVLKVLAKYFPDFLEHRDIRGWTLLHVAAEFGHEDIVRYLLSHGADWQARSWPSHVHVPEDLDGVCCTPTEAARTQGREQRFLELVDEVLGEKE